MNKLFKSSEEVVSMFLGLVIVVILVGLVFNYFQKRRGSISLPGVTDNNQLALAGKKEIEDKKVVESTGDTYTVVAGDSLWKIAQNKLGNGDKWTELAKTNNLSNPRVLLVGQKLNIPKSDTITKFIESTQKTSVTENETYKVVKGDCLWKIAVAKYGDGYKWTKIWNENKKMLINPGKLEIGMSLVLPKVK